MTIKAPDPTRQIRFHQQLVAARKLWLADALAETLAKTDARQIKEELSRLVPSDAMAILASAGIRDEHVFPTPTVLEKKPTLVGYYRLLLGSPQKTFYGFGSGMGQFKAMEVDGTLTDRQKNLLPDFCASMCGALAELARQIDPAVTKTDVRDLPLLTLGQQFQGANNNKIGQDATRNVFLAVKEIVRGRAVDVTKGQIALKNASGRRVLLAVASDPDIRVEEEAAGGVTHKNVAIEIKGGADKSNTHNRAGEAEKSHQKAKQDGFRNFWTLISLKGMDLAKLRKESPTTNEWFDVAQVLARSGPDWDRFQEHLVQAVGIPQRATKRGKRPKSST